MYLESKIQFTLIRNRVIDSNFRTFQTGVGEPRVHFWQATIEGQNARSFRSYPLFPPSRIAWPDLRLLLTGGMISGTCNSSTWQLVDTEIRNYRHLYTNNTFSCVSILSLYIQAHIDSSPTMASAFLISPLRSRLPLLIGLGTFSAATLLLPNRPRTHYLDATSSTLSPKDWSYSQYQRDAQAPVLSKKGGLNPNAVRQVSLGSIVGQ